MTKSHTKERPSEPATIVPDFQHVPGRHCGSTALADLLRFYGLDLPEGVVFGLAAGACFYYVALPGSSPSYMINGRAAQLERQFLKITQGPFLLRESDDPDDAWQLAREQIDGDEPALLLTDLYYLEYYDKSAHFPGHAVVLAGYDDEYAYLADTDKPGLQVTSLSSLQSARHAKPQPLPIKGDILTVRSKDALENMRQQLPELCRKAMSTAAETMLVPPFSDAQGIPAMRRLAAEIEQWPERVEDWRWCTRFAYQVIERRGTGGGNFRKLYSEFLAYAHEVGAGQDLDAASEAFSRVATDWTELSFTLRDASEQDTPDSETWITIAEQVENLALDEERLWTGLAEAVV